MSFSSKLITLALCSTAMASGATLTVCAACSPHSTIASAYAAAADGDVIVLAAGESFTGNLEILKSLAFRSSANANLPGAGYRVNRARHAAMMPALTGLITIGYLRSTAIQNGVDTEADTIEFAAQTASQRLALGVKVACAAPPSNGGMPGGMPRGEYWVKSLTDLGGGAVKASFSLTPGGATVDLTSQGAAANASYYYRPDCTRVGGPAVTFDGIRFTYTGLHSQVTVGDRGQVIRAHGPSVKLRHSLLGGVAGTWTGPYVGVQFFDGHDHELSDSDVDYVYWEGGESSAVKVLNSDGVLLRNNRLIAGAIILLTGGANVHSQLSERRVRVLGNRFEKPGYMWFRKSTAAPSGNCNPGAFARRDGVASNAQCYVCGVGGTWGSASDTALCPAGRWNNKNHIEFKNCEDCDVVGNVFIGQPSTVDAGQGWAFGCSVLTSAEAGAGEGYSQCKNTKFARNYAVDVRAGFQLTNGTYTDVAFWDVPVVNVLVEDTLLEHLGNEDWEAACDLNVVDADTCLYINGATRPAAIGLGAALKGVTITRFTSRGHGTNGMLMTLGPASAPPTLAPFRLRDSLLQTTVARISGIEYYQQPTHAEYPAYTELTNCTAWGASLGDGRIDHTYFWYAGTQNSKPDFVSGTGCSSFAANTTYSTTDPLFVSASDSRLQAGSDLIAAASDGGPLGADIELIEQHKTAALAGTPTAERLMALRINEGTGSLTFKIAPEAGSCTATVYSSRARTGGASETGTSSITVSAGAGRKWYKVVCGSLSWADEAVVH
jgi:hypothetical protein